MSIWTPVIGLEVHSRLLTETKLFCRCPSDWAAPPNSNVCPICLGHPGALPVPNRRAIELAVRLAVAVGCEIAAESRFSRKNYFYPDLPKGYQITQYDRPFARGGAIPIRLRDGSEREIPLERIHLEEDAGKLIHDTATERSLVDFNRAGTALVEIVGTPAITSPAEAVAWLNRLRQIIMYTGAGDGNMEEGSLRCDANVSVHREGEPFGKRVEIKNLNSFRFIARALEFEIERQISTLEAGGQVSQETRSFDPGSGETRLMRSKEEAHDYRYFDEPDLGPLVLDDGAVERARGDVPRLPHERIASWLASIEGMTAEDAEAIAATRESADWFDDLLRHAPDGRMAANWMKNEVAGLLSGERQTISDLRISPEATGQLLRMIASGSISGRIGKEVFAECARSGDDPETYVEQHGLAQISDPVLLRSLAERIVESSPDEVAAYRGGRTNLLGFFVGQVMKETNGRANPALTRDIVIELVTSKGNPT